MRSPYNWAVLALLIELPSYGYELAQRFERTYEDALRLSSHAQVYKALDALQARGLIEALLPDESAIEELRQPRPRYEATAEGLLRYEDWLLAQAREERQRARLLARALTLLKPPAALAVIDRLEHAYREEAKRTPTDTTDDDRFLDGASALTTDLIHEQDRLLVKARLSWIKLARRKLEALSAQHGQPR
jgi:DNA-binding PadR family transcriptional regulator